MGEGQRHSSFISEAIQPHYDQHDLSGMSRGIPALPEAFSWREKSYRVVKVLDSWKKYGREGHSERGELYLRRHYFRLAVDSGEIMTVYFERQARNPKLPKTRWFLFTIETTGK